MDQSEDDQRSVTRRRSVRASAAGALARTDPFQGSPDSATRAAAMGDVMSNSVAADSAELTGDEVRPFRIEVAQADLDDLRDRLGRTRWPSQIANTSWERGVPVDYLEGLAAYWRDGFDWRAEEAKLNAFPQFTTAIDGQTIHFVHVRSPEAEATPLLLLHGWPGSFVEFVDTIAPLTDPAAHGGEAADAFHVVVPSIPGFGFSTPLSEAGWGNARIAEAFAELMARLGYDRYAVQGGDIGAFLAPSIGQIDAEHVIGVHVNALVTFPSGDPAEMEGLTPAEQERLARLEHFQQDMMAYAQQMGTRPQTLAYGLADSPAGQLAWIGEKFKEWTDPAGELPEEAVDRDHLLTDISLYWFTNTAGTSANHYYESFHDPSAFAPRERGTVPTGVLVSLTQDVAIRRFAERDHNVVHWTEVERGGHFMAMEQPEQFVEDVRQFFRSLR